MVIFNFMLSIDNILYDHQHHLIHLREMTIFRLYGLNLHNGEITMHKNVPTLNEYMEVFISLLGKSKFQLMNMPDDL